MGGCGCKCDQPGGGVDENESFIATMPGVKKVDKLPEITNPSVKLALEKYGEDGDFNEDPAYGSCKGPFLYPNGEVYKGQYDKALRCGFGTNFYPNSSIYQGMWFHDTKDGLGRYVEPNGDVFIGEFKGGIKTDKGKQYKLNGSKYVEKK